MSVSELACTYASLALFDDGIAINAEKIASLIQASNISCESYWPSLFAKLLEKKNVEDLILNVGAGGAAAPASAVAGGAAAPAAEEKKEEKKEEVLEESDEDMCFTLFD